MPVDAPGYPVVLDLRGRSCLVVGGGRVALGKVRNLLSAGANVTLVSTDVTDELARLEGVKVVARPYRTGDVDGHRLVVTATGDPAVDGRVSRDAQAAGIWVNSADDPANCSFTLPAVARRGPITVAVSTGGRSPAMAVWLRDRFGAELDEAHVTLLDLLGERRAELRREGRPTEGLSWQAVLDSGMLDLIRAGSIDEARERIRTCL